MDRIEFEPLHLRVIWFWQVARYLDDGWTINRDGGSINPRSWVSALLNAIRPRAVRSMKDA